MNRSAVHAPDEDPPNAAVTRFEAEEANTALVVNGNLDAAEDFFTPDYVAHITERDLEGGPAGVRQFVRMLCGAFSDLAERLLLS